MSAEMVEYCLFKEEREAIELSIFSEVSSGLKRLNLEELVFLSAALKDYETAFEPNCGGLLGALLCRFSRMNLPAMPIWDEAIDPSFMNDYREAVKRLARSVEQHEKEVAEAESRKAAEEIQKEAAYLDRMKISVGNIAVALTEEQRKFAEKTAKRAPATVITARAA